MHILCDKVVKPYCKWSERASESDCAYYYKFVWYTHYTVIASYTLLASLSKERSEQKKKRNRCYSLRKLYNHITRVIKMYRIIHYTHMLFFNWIISIRAFPKNFTWTSIVEMKLNVFRISLIFYFIIQFNHLIYQENYTQCNMHCIHRTLTHMAHNCREKFSMQYYTIVHLNLIFNIIFEYMIKFNWILTAAAAL